MSSYEDNLNSGQRSIKLLSLYAIRFCSILWEVVACNEVFRVVPFTSFVFYTFILHYSEIYRKKFYIQVRMFVLYYLSLNSYEE